MPRRYFTYAPEFQLWHVLSSAGATILAAAYLMPLVYLSWSFAFGRRASANPWGATGLEWRTPSPPPTHNFETTPIVTWGAYEYHESGAPAHETAPAATGAPGGS